MADDLSDAFKEIRELKREVRRLQNARPLENSSVTNGRMRFVGGLLRIDSGGRVEIVGALQVDGATVATGTFRIEGPWTFTGNGTISGNVNITGTLTQNGTWAFNGNGTVTGDMNVTGGGRVKVGTMTLDPSISGGAMTFGNGAQVFTDSTTIQVYKGNGVVQVSDTEVKMQLGGTAIRLLSGRVLVTGMATRPVSAFPGGFVNAIVYESGEMKRLV